MKNFIAFALLLVVAQSSFAAQYYYNVTTTSQDNRGEACPEISKAVIDDNLAQGQVTMILQNSKKTMTLTTHKNYESTTCYSDIVCPTSVIFEDINNMFISVERKNDGNYPTTNEPGFNSIQIGLYKLADKNLTWTAFCNYDLK